MKTFGDLRKFISSAHLDMDLFGRTKELKEAFSERGKAIGSAICLERNISEAEVMGLPSGTLLGEKSRALAEGLRTWFILETADKK